MPREPTHAVADLLAHLAVSAALQGPPDHLLQLCQVQLRGKEYQFFLQVTTVTEIEGSESQTQVLVCRPGANTPLPSATSCPPAQLSTAASGPTSDAEVTALHRLHLSGTQNDKATAPTLV